MNKSEALRLALEALEMSRRFVYADNRPQCDEAIDALRAALAQQEPVQEPVAWLYEEGADSTLHWNKPPLYGTPLYLSPPQRQPLTDEEIIDAVREADLDWTRGWTLDETQSNRFVTLARAIERAHGIGEQP